MNFNPNSGSAFNPIDILMYQFNNLSKEDQEKFTAQASKKIKQEKHKNSNSNSIKSLAKKAQEQHYYGIIANFKKNWVKQ